MNYLMSMVDWALKRRATQDGVDVARDNSAKQQHGYLSKCLSPQAEGAAPMPYAIDVN